MTFFFVITGFSADEELAVESSLSFKSQYISHGFDVSDDKPVLQPQIKILNILPGLEAAYWGNKIVEDRTDNGDEFDLYLKYSGNLGGDTGFFLLVNYWTQYNINPESLEGFKLGAGINHTFSLNECTSFIPYYNVYYWLPLHKGNFSDGFANEAGFKFVRSTENRYLKNYYLDTSLNHHTGAFGVDSALSHMTISSGMNFEVNSSLTISPSISFQNSLENTVNTDDELWFSLAITKRF